MGSSSTKKKTPSDIYTTETLETFPWGVKEVTLNRPISLEIVTSYKHGRETTTVCFMGTVEGFGNSYDEALVDLSTQLENIWDCRTLPARDIVTFAPVIEALSTLLPDECGE